MSASQEFGGVCEANRSNGASSSTMTSTIHFSTVQHAARAGGQDKSRLPGLQAEAGPLPFKTLQPVHSVTVTP